MSNSSSPLYPQEVRGTRLAVYPNQEAVAEAAGARLLLYILDRLSYQDELHIGLTGGTVGIKMLACAAQNPLIASIDWKRVHFWWGDERFVEETSPERNALQAREALLDLLVERYGLVPEHIHEMPADTRSASERAEATDEQDERAVAYAAKRYQLDLSMALGEKWYLDLLIFGMGPDGHCASLFPHSPQLNITDPQEWVVGVTHAPKLPPLRISLSMMFIDSALSVWFVADGVGKADAARRALVDDCSPLTPSSYAAGIEDTLWMLDEAAAQDIKTLFDAGELPAS